MVTVSPAITALVYREDDVSSAVLILKRSQNEFSHTLGHGEFKGSRAGEDDLPEVVQSSWLV